MSELQDDSRAKAATASMLKDRNSSKTAASGAAAPAVKLDGDNSSSAAISSKKPTVHYDPSQVKEAQQEKEKEGEPKEKTKTKLPFRHSRRVVIGDGKGTPFRDVIVFLTIVGGLFGASFLLSPNDNKAATVGGGDKSKKGDQIAKPVKIPFGETINKLQQSFQTSILEHMEPFRRKEDCRIFISIASGSTGGSSIPGAGQGLFAGKFYEPGDVVLETFSLIPIIMPMTTTALDHHHHHQSPSYFLLSPYALLLKFHPTLANIAGTTVFTPNASGKEIPFLVDVKFRATRPIRPGDELFLSLEEHPLGIWSQQQVAADAAVAAASVAAQSFFSHIPVSKDYEMADGILHDLYSVSRQMEVAHGRRQQNPMASIDTSYLLVLTRKVVAKFDAKVAQLLPQSKLEWKQRQRSLKFDHSSFVEPTHLACLKNKTLEHLQRTASCVSDIQKVVVTHYHGDLDDYVDYDSSLGVVVTRSVKKNDNLSFIPIQAIRAPPHRPSTSCRVEEDGQEHQCEWNNESDAAGRFTGTSYNALVSKCFGTATSLLLLCPLTDFAWITTTTTTASPPTAPGATLEIQPEPNVQIKWRSSDMTKPSVDEILSSAALQNLWWEVTALRDIQSGEKLVMKGGESTIQYNPASLLTPRMRASSLPETLIPKHWRQQA